MLDGVSNKLKTIYFSPTTEAIPGSTTTEMVEETVISYDSSIEELEEYIAQREKAIDFHQEEINKLTSNTSDNASEAYGEYKTAEDNLTEILQDKGIFGFFGKKYLARVKEIQEQENKIQEKELILNSIDDKILSSKNSLIMCSDEVDALEIAKDENNEFEYESEWQNKNLKELNDAIDEHIEITSLELSAYSGNKQYLEDERKKIASEIKALKDKVAEIEESKNIYGKFVEFFYNKESDKALDEYLITKEEYEKIKAEQKTTETNEIETIQEEIRYANEILKAKKIEQYKKEYGVENYEFNFEVNLEEFQQRDLNDFVKNFNENSQSYEIVQEATGVPAELVAAIHWRECTGDFSKYLHNGEPLGYTTTKTPKGLYFEDWTDAAIHAIKSHEPEIIKEGNIESWYEYAENYNGWGYRNMGLPSPYIWSGTDNYSCGKFVADGSYSSSYKDTQLGVAVMVRELLT